MTPWLGRQQNAQNTMWVGKQSQKSQNNLPWVFFLTSIMSTLILLCYVMLCFFPDIYHVYLYLIHMSMTCTRFRAFNCFSRPQFFGFVDFKLVQLCITKVSVRYHLLWTGWPRWETCRDEKIEDRRNFFLHRSKVSTKYFKSSTKRERPRFTKSYISRWSVVSGSKAMQR